MCGAGCGGGDQLTMWHHADPDSAAGAGAGAGPQLSQSRGEVIKRTLSGAITDIMTPDTPPACLVQEYCDRKVFPIQS